MSDCACKPNAPIHPWEPGEWCPPTRVVPLREKIGDVLGADVVLPVNGETVYALRQGIVERDATIEQLRERVDHWHGVATEFFNAIVDADIETVAERAAGILNLRDELAAVTAQRNQLRSWLDGASTELVAAYETGAALREELAAANERGDGWREKFNADTLRIEQLTKCPRCDGTGTDPGTEPWRYYGVPEPGSYAPCALCNGGAEPVTVASLYADLERLRVALRYVSSPTMALPSGVDALEFAGEGAKDADVRAALVTCIRMARETVGP